jgi:hypothetical protein
MIYRTQTILAILVLCFSAQLASQEVEGITTPGGFALIPIFSFDRPSMRFGLRPIAVLDELADNGVWLGLVGIDLVTAPGQYLVTKTNHNDGAQDDLVDITVQPIKHDLRPSRTITSRIEEYLRNALTEDSTDDTAKNLIGEWQQSRFFSFPFQIPLEQGIMDQEAVGTYVRYPSGKFDLVNALFVRTNDISTPVTAPSGGMIHRIKQPEGRLVNTSIVIDHGQGVFSILRGEIFADIEVGDVVEEGETVALFTTEDRPEIEGTWELSWQLALNGDLVDPSHFLRLNIGAYLQKLSTDAEAHYSAIQAAIQAAEQISIAQKESEQLDDAGSGQADEPLSISAPTAASSVTPGEFGC